MLNEVLKADFFFGELPTYVLLHYHFVAENQGTASALSHSHSFPPWSARGRGSSRGTAPPVKQDKPVSGGGDLPTVFLFLRGWGQRRIKHPLILPSTSLCNPLVAHPPLPSGSSPLWRGGAQRHHRPRPVPKSLCKCQWEPVLRVDDRGSGGPEAAPAL